jgi:hypothetical protein
MGIMDKAAEVEDAALEEHLLAHRETLAESFSEAQRAVARNDVASLAEIASRASQQRAQAAVSRN